MPPRFADLESRVNGAVFKHLSNTVATLAGVEVQGILRQPYAQDDLVLGGVASSAPLFDLASSAVPDDVVGSVLMVGETAYTVVEPMPDGTGITTLRLRA